MIFAIVGPSGAGKDTLIAGALAARPDLRRVRRVITRPAEAGGEEFEGVSEADFARRRDAGEFALHWPAHGLHYGIPRAQIDGPGDVIFNGSRAALRAARAVLPDLRVILITAPDAVLAERLAARGRESAADIQARLARAGFALPEGIAAVTVVNDGAPERGIARLLAALQPDRA
ncbi:phosphonate metabolism protein/1,5-bisphosphokinase (PRPP-forming) PhnN [Fuscovulum blasticum]|uniref:phosphonate metabolism protein/1,5-bisphosphokinase (PRPP-forming) PhnN n=1 Tax=Fuscovulum blasticum TaxID=1075 RepID=UPI000D3E1461|nr:phosphonate metabolism protein/1,5-bisphosphokinase (PRPP-forming) PhnN [Fuscovulum blasticum]AWD20240.1 phosphonate metabolism protein/1,5-bisphosphokinase (PRPP-forming) PhnN [Fuscovulum blasticum]